MADEKIVLDSKERVAYELMIKISDSDSERNTEKDRKYWLNLYRECFIAVSGNQPQ